MCVVCGCSDSAGAATAGRAGEASGQHLNFGAGAARVSVPGLSQERAISIEADVLGANDRFARANREHFLAHRVLALNLVSSPGAGKTTLLCATIEALRERTRLPVGVIEGDQQTSFDADRIRATGAPAVQVNTGKGCHLDAQMVAQAFSRLPLHDHGHGHHHGHAHGKTHGHEHVHPHTAHVHDPSHSHDDAQHTHTHTHPHQDSHTHAHPPAAAHETQALAGMQGILFIENVGNLVCPALWDLGEAAKIVILSVTEGEDKPLKYPDMFAAARLMVLNKIDLLPHLRFDVERCIDYARRVNPSIEVIQVSAATGEGFDAWLDWILAAHAPRIDRNGRGAAGGQNHAHTVGVS